MLLGLETFSYHLAFAYGKMNIFNFVERTAALGLDGVQINVEGDDLAHLGNDDLGFLREVQATIEDLGLFVELDTCDTNPRNLIRILDICNALGADKMRVYSSFGGDIKEELMQAAENFLQVVPLCADYGIKIAYENHEFESSQDILGVVHLVNSEFVGTHVDVGNSMMMWEDPIDAITAMAPHAVSTHFKDHVVVMLNHEPMIIGVPLGKGNIDLAESFRILAQQSPLDRINIEVCYGYMAPFRVSQPEGCGAKLGEGSFQIQQPPFDPEIVAPYLLRYSDQPFELESYSWQDLSKIPESEYQRDEFVGLQEQAVFESVDYVKKLNA